ncbi:acyltransferase [Sphingomonas sp. PL-96]|uniref:acyltransferase family protein n=1 Tax=Sphingomonas sp. PL-96 TaxID=2887201 RepID=UPI001E38841B|nr:acyltransferase [Sphingomonas sp. PL-96]MCC2976603.1 acyltransferase [Sphingomonas sp. PL-96]
MASTDPYIDRLWQRRAERADVSAACARSSRLGAWIDFFRLRPESEQFLHLDALRFLASAGIVAFHYQQWVAWRDPPVRLEAMFGFGQFVDLFFVISGIVIHDLYRGRMATPRDFGRFLRKRVARLLPLHWLTLGFFCAVALLAERFGRTGSDADWACLVPNALLVHAFGICRDLSFNTPSWSISAEMTMYAGFPLVLVLLRRPHLAWGVWLLILAGLTLLTAGAESPWYERTHDLGVLRAVPAFLFGALLDCHRPLLGRIVWAPTLMWATLALFVALRLAEASPLLRLACVYLVPLFGLAADQRQHAARTVRAIAPLGQLTYSLYMLHIPVAWVVLSFAAPRLHLGDGEVNVAVLVTAFVVLPIASILSLRLFETPMRRWLGTPGQARTGPRSTNRIAKDFAP